MDGFKNTTRMRTFTSSADVARTAGRTVGRVPAFSQGGRVFARGGHAVDKIDGEHDVEQVDPNHADADMHGHGLMHRDNPQSTAELEEGGGRSPLRSGYAKGGKTTHFHVHKHYHTGGKTNTKSRSYGSAEKAAEREVEGAGPMMATGGTRDKLKKGGIHIKAKNKGALHRDMGVPQGQKIPKSKIRSKLAHDKASGNTKGVKRDTFALNFGHKGHADGGHIHDETHIPSSYPDYATGGTIDCLSAGGGAYGGMATGGTTNPLATGGTINEMAIGGMLQRPVRVGAPAGGSAFGSLAARRPMPVARPQMPVGRPQPAPMRPGLGNPVMRAKGGPASPVGAARAAVREHVAAPAPRGHKGLGRMLGRK